MAGSVVTFTFSCPKGDTPGEGRMMEVPTRLWAREHESTKSVVQKEIEATFAGQGAKSEYHQKT